MKKHFLSFCTCLFLSLLAGNVMAQDVTEPSVPHANDPAWNKTSKNLQAAWGDTNLQTDKFTRSPGPGRSWLPCLPGNRKTVFHSVYLRIWYF